MKTFNTFVFDEILLWHSYDRIRTYRGKAGFSTDVRGLLRDVLWRITEGGNHGRILVASSLSYICASRMGLAEDELLDLLSRDLNVYAEFVIAAAHFPPDLIRHTGRHLERTSSTDTADARAVAFFRELRKDRPTLESILSSLIADQDGPRLPIVLWSRLHSDLVPYLAVRDANGPINSPKPNSGGNWR